jgi:oligopeptide/dipeptide ABC transporter ATP-binding protein
MSAELLRVENLVIQYRTGEGSIRAVDEISFSIKNGENLGLVGESGCGKTTAAKAIMKILPANGEIVGGKILFQGRDIISMGQKDMRNLRWNEIAMITQSAMNSLDPVHRVGDQIVEAIQAHSSISTRDAIIRVRELFDIVGLDPHRINDYPHQFSGGMKQRAIIAMALALNPSLIIADEPTTALDVLVQDRILMQLNELQHKMNMSMIIITHDISVVAETCSRVAVMYAGKIMEYGAVTCVFKTPYNPYTMGLLNAFPSVVGKKRELISIGGFPPNLLNPPKGCRFWERCPFSSERCARQTFTMVKVGEDHFSACPDIHRVEEMRDLAVRPETWREKQS